MFLVLLTKGESNDVQKIVVRALQTWVLYLLLLSSALSPLQFLSALAPSEICVCCFDYASCFCSEAQTSTHQCRCEATSPSTAVSNAHAAQKSFRRWRTPSTPPQLPSLRRRPYAIPPTRWRYPYRSTWDPSAWICLPQPDHHRGRPVRRCFHASDALPMQTHAGTSMIPPASPYQIRLARAA